MKQSDRHQFLANLLANISTTAAAPCATDEHFRGVLNQIDQYVLRGRAELAKLSDEDAAIVAAQAKVKWEKPLSRPVYDKVIIDEQRADREYVGQSHYDAEPVVIDESTLANTQAREWSEFTADQRVVDFAHQKHLILKKGRMWLWCRREYQTNKDGSRRFGAVQGLDGKDVNGRPNEHGRAIRGTVRITNGVDVWVELENGEMFLAHWDNIVFEGAKKGASKAKNDALKAQIWEMLAASGKAPNGSKP